MKIIERHAEFIAIVALVLSFALPAFASTTLECEQAIVDACVDTAPPDGSRDCEDEYLQVEFAACLPAALRLPGVESLDEMMHVGCENLVYALVAPGTPDDSTTPLGEAGAVACCRWG